MRRHRAARATAEAVLPHIGMSRVLPIAGLEDADAFVVDEERWRRGGLDDPAQV